MNWKLVESNWQQVKINVKEQWSKLSDGQLNVIAGKRDKLLAHIHTTYGISKHAAEWQLSGWEGRRNAMDDL